MLLWCEVEAGCRWWIINPKLPTQFHRLVQSLTVLIRWLVKQEAHRFSDGWMSHAMLSSETAGESGNYYKNTERATPTKLARDEDVQEKLWNRSVSITETR